MAYLVLGTHKVILVVIAGGATLTPGETYIKAPAQKPKAPAHPHAILTNLTEGTAHVTINGKTDTITVSDGNLDGSFAGHDEFASDILDKNNNPVSLPNNNKDWKVRFSNVTAPQSANSLFDGKHDIQGSTTNWFGNQVSDIDLTGLNMNDTTNMISSLINDPNLKHVEFGTKDLSNVTNMGMALGSDTNLISVDLSGITDHNLNTMYDIFDTDPNLTHVKLGAGLSANGPVDLSEMFASDTKLPFSRIDWNGFDTKNASDMNGMFGYSDAISDLNLPAGFDTRKAYNNMSTMFESDVPDGGLKNITTNSSDTIINPDAWSWGNHNFYKEASNGKQVADLSQGSKGTTTYSTTANKSADKKPATKPLVNITISYKNATPSDASDDGKIVGTQTLNGIACLGDSITLGAKGAHDGNGVLDVLQAPWGFDLSSKINPFSITIKKQNVSMIADAPILNLTMNFNSSNKKPKKPSNTPFTMPSNAENLAGNFSNSNANVAQKNNQLEVPKIL